MRKRSECAFSIGYKNPAREGWVYWLWKDEVIWALGPQGQRCCKSVSGWVYECTPEEWAEGK